MHVSFSSDGRWFVFDQDGKTLAKNLKSKPLALGWIAKRTPQIPPAGDTPNGD